MVVYATKSKDKGRTDNLKIKKITGEQDRKVIGVFENK
jgi:hypothetical protein